MKIKSTVYYANTRLYGIQFPIVLNSKKPVDIACLKIDGASKARRNYGGVEGSTTLELF